ncbi:50S ribosomal protein L17 [Candidatus Acetothermia bacterium]|nr:50S ribosomal protein L17 [Candidatus Acetothermia bacterium]MBI3642894.1 50S ribosomal protein L17 [Candidatus Acetothermia bacterium]
MRHRKSFRKLGRISGYRKLMMAGQVKVLIEHGKVDTTVHRAKESAVMANKMITWAKRGDMHSRRLAFRILQDKKMVEKLFAELGPKYTSRDGGYTRVLRIPPRIGDGAEMARLMWV